MEFEPLSPRHPQYTPLGWFLMSVFLFLVRNWWLSFLWLPVSYLVSGTWLSLAFQRPTGIGQGLLWLTDGNIGQAAVVANMLMLLNVALSPVFLAAIIYRIVHDRLAKSEKRTAIDNRTIE